MPGLPSTLRDPQRLVLVGLAAFSVVVQTLTLPLLLSDPGGQVRLHNGYLSVAVSAAMLALALWPRVRLKTLQALVVTLVSAWFVANIWTVFLTRRPITSGLLMHAVLVGLFAYSWMPVRRAGLLVLLCFALLAAATVASRVPDVPGLLSTALVLVLTWYLSVYGRVARVERSRSSELASLAFTDPLTGVLNRRSGQERLQALTTAWAGDPARFSLVFFDLDHFKAINDAFGHQRGDTVLVSVAEVLLSAVPDARDVVRWGGEEFLLLLPGRSEAEAREAAGRVLAGVRALRLPGFPPLSVSGGLAVLSEVQDVPELLDLADRRLYRAKAEGRDRLV